MGTARCHPPAMLLLITLLVPPAPAAEVRLLAPLSTLVPVEDARPGAERDIVAMIEVPSGAPADLGVAAWAGDRHGSWHQRNHPVALRPGRALLRFALGAGAPLAGAVPWNAQRARGWTHGGLVFWSAQGAPTAIRVDWVRAIEHETTVPAARLVDLRAASHGRTGERWELRCRPQPWPAEPDDPAEFRLDAEIAAPDGSLQRIAGFRLQEVRLRDRGDREVATAAGEDAFALRFRPRQPGPHRVRVTATWAGGARASTELTLAVEGPAWDGYARIDRGDPRFWSVDGTFWWPSGPNLRSLNDTRCEERLGTHPMPEAGATGYDAWFARMGAAGCTATEVWLSSWNLAPEWNAAWQGYDGAGRYDPRHGAQLDRILDHAWHHGIRIALVVSNHGQGSTDVDPEWKEHPWNRVNGGPLSSPDQLFTDARAAAGQARMRRYLIARYGDHPAMLAWTLWNELEWTDLGRYGDHTRITAWYAAAAQAWRTEDPYGHPVTAHYSGFERPGLADLVRLPAASGVSTVATNAYRKREESLAERLGAIHRLFGGSSRPVMLHEACGINADGMEPLLSVDHASAGWAALVHGLGGSPHNWWANWVLQRGGFGPYAATAAFLHGEDLRGAEARHVRLVGSASARPLWAGAWTRPGRMLFYAGDLSWLRSGGSPPDLAGGTLIAAASAAAGTMRIAWHDAWTGALLRMEEFQHPGGALRLTIPPADGHIAGKLMRIDPH